MQGDNEMENENKCKSCFYYIENYIKRTFGLQPIGGHCVNPELNRRYTKRKYELHENCIYWKSNEDKKTERKESIEQTIRKIEKNLSDIVFILKSDK